jgi:hypothetical protein
VGEIKTRSAAGVFLIAAIAVLAAAAPSSAAVSCG